MMRTPEQIKRFKAQQPEHASLEDETIDSLITAIIKKLEAQAAIASFDDDEFSSAPTTRTKSVAAPTKAELIVAEMSPAARKNFLRDFMYHEVSDSSGPRVDGVASDPGPILEGDSLASDSAPSSR